MDEGTEPPAKRQKLEDDSNSEPLKHEKGQDTDFTKDVDDSEGRFTIDDDKYNNYVHPDELERLHEFQVLDEVKSNDEDSNDEESDSSDGIDAKSDVPEEEIEKMLEEDLPEDFKGAPKQKEKAYITRQKVVLEEKGVNTFEVLPLDWMMVRHYSGMPVYMHRATRVCTLSKPYFLGKGNTRRHDIPISAIPCYAYRRALEEEEKQKEIDKQIEEQIKNGTWQQHTATGNKNTASVNNKTDSTKSMNDNKTPKCPYLHGKGLGKHTQVPDNHDELIRKELDKTSESNDDITDKLTEMKDKVNDMIVNEANDNIDDKLKNLEEPMEDDRVKENQDDVTKYCAEKLSESKGLESKNETPSIESSESNSQDIVIESKSNNSQSTNDSQDEVTNKTGSENRPKNITTTEKRSEDNATSGNGPDNNASNENGSGDNFTTENSSENNASAENEPEGNATIDNANNDNSPENNATNENSQENASKGGIPLKCQPVVLPGGIVMPPPRVETVSTSWKTQHLTHEQVNNYCKRLFKFKTVNIMHFKRWADRRKYAKARKTLQYPTLPEGTKLITIPAQPANGQENGGKANKRDWVMNMNGRSYLSVFHEYVRRALQKQPVYEFKQLENAATPYQATVYIGGMQYGVGHGSSKRAAKSAAARASIHILIPEMRGELDEERPEAERGSTSEPDFSFFDYVGIEDPRITEFCAATCEPSPHAILRTCLLRNFGAGDKHIHTEMKKLEYQKIELTMKVGKHTATVVCKNKKTAKQRASQAILQALHPHVRSWGSLLRLYGSRSVKSCKEKKLEEQQITLLQDAARHNEPNYAVLEKLRHEMKKLRERDEAVVPIGTLLLKDDLPTHSGSNLNNVDL